MSRLRLLGDPDAIDIELVIGFRPAPIRLEHKGFCMGSRRRWACHQASKPCRKATAACGNGSSITAHRALLDTMSVGALRTMTPREASIEATKSG